MHPSSGIARCVPASPSSRTRTGVGWQVFRYADVVRVLSEYATFSSDGQRIEQAFGLRTSPTQSGLASCAWTRHAIATCAI